MDKVYVVLRAFLPVEVKLAEQYPNIEWAGIGGVFGTMEDATAAVKLQHLTGVLYWYQPTKDRLPYMMEQHQIQLADEYPMKATDKTRRVYQIQECDVRTVKATPWSEVLRKPLGETQTEAHESEGV